MEDKLLNIRNGKFNLSFDGIFTAKTRHFQGCLRVWSRGHQVRGHTCKLRKLAIFFHAKKI